MKNQEVFYQADRDRIKSRSMLPSDTLAYIEALEQIARAAFAYWTNSSRRNDLQVSYDNDLYDALARVNFLDETL